MEGELRANRARQVAIDGFHVTSQKPRIKAVSLAFYCVLYIIIGNILIFFSRSVNFSSSYGILKNTVADVSIVLKGFKTIFRKKIWFENARRS